MAGEEDTKAPEAKERGRAEAVRGADGAWRVEGEEADIEGYKAARDRVVALAAELSAQGEVTAKATEEAAAARAAAESLLGQVQGLEQGRDALQARLDETVSERDAARLEAQALRADILSKDSEIQGLKRRIDADGRRLLKIEGRPSPPIEGQAEP